MKVFYIILTIVVIVFICIQVFAMSSRNGIESYPFKVVKAFETFEIRTYEPRLFTSVTINTNDYAVASSNGFSKLAGYIFGGNETNEKIAMTSPVAMSLEDSMTMMFLLPKTYNRDNLPKPNTSDITFVDEPAKTVAVITFGGWANNENIAQQKQLLIDALSAEGIPHTGNFSFLGYNPPYDLVNRKNEVMVELEPTFID